MARLNAARLALLGTLRHDGSPRISPVEPVIVGGQLLIGAMAWSAKAGDLRRDPRYVLRSAVTGPDSSAGARIGGAGRQHDPQRHRAP
jgi:predicted pyridoxine 5'-phosphate oxidase superfamily flavin-nucleotide-binding protein